MQEKEKPDGQNDEPSVHTGKARKKKREEK